jgi:methionyl-tRNA formyltransferase
MSEKKLRIVFSGTPIFASVCLEKLINEGFDVVAVITAPDRKKGRGQLLVESSVKETAVKHGIKVFQPTNLKDPIFNAELAALRPDLGVVVAFRMLPESIWNMPSLGTVNLHASLLPNYRGAAPINWVLINGEQKTGITTFFLKHEIDTGDVVKQLEVSISDKMNAGELHDLLALKGAQLLSETVRVVQNGNYKKIPQRKMISEGAALKMAPKIFKEDGKIDWTDPANKIYNKIRGLSPYPAAWTELNKNGKTLTIKIFKASVSHISSKGKQAHIEVKDKSQLLIGTADFYLVLHEIQLEGKQKTDVPSFLRGNDLSEATINT